MERPSKYLQRTFYNVQMQVTENGTGPRRKRTTVDPTSMQMRKPQLMCRLQEEAQAAPRPPPTPLHCLLLRETRRSRNPTHTPSTPGPLDPGHNRRPRTRPQTQGTTPKGTGSVPPLHGLPTKKPPPACYREAQYTPPRRGESFQQKHSGPLKQGSLPRGKGLPDPVTMNPSSRPARGSWAQAFHEERRF